MSKIIGLIACSSRKLGQDNLAEKYLAKDIYKGNTFIKSKEEGLKKYKCEEWYILSGKYGLLDKNERISYYNLYLGKQSAEYKKKWAENVLNTLKSKYDLKNDAVSITMQRKRLRCKENQRNRISESIRRRCFQHRRLTSAYKSRNFHYTE